MLLLGAEHKKPKRVNTSAWGTASLSAVQADKFEGSDLRLFSHPQQYKIVYL